MRIGYLQKIFLSGLAFTVVFRLARKIHNRKLKVPELDPTSLPNLEPSDPDFLFYNRVPKTGSEMVTKLLSNLGQQSGRFKHHRYGAPNPRLLTAEAQVTMNWVLADFFHQL